MWWFIATAEQSGVRDAPSITSTLCKADGRLTYHLYLGSHAQITGREETEWTDSIGSLVLDSRVISWSTQLRYGDPFRAENGGWGRTPPSQQSSRVILCFCRILPWTGFITRTWLLAILRIVDLDVLRLFASMGRTSFISHQEDALWVKVLLYEVRVHAISEW